MSQDVNVSTYTEAVELVSAGSWAIASALRCLEAGDVERAQGVLAQAQSTVREGLSGLSEVLETLVRDSYERPERLARALESLQELRDLQPTAEAG